MDFISSSSIESIKEWQDLIGAVTGASLAGAIAFLTYLITRYFNRKDEFKEALRQIEISNTYSLHSTYQLQSKIHFFTSRIHDLVQHLRTVENQMEVTNSSINFQPLGSIYLDPSLHLSKVKSYYLHNKLLVTHAFIAEVNNTVNQLGNDFEKIIQMNLFLIDGSKPIDPVSARFQYADNLERYALTLNRFANSLNLHPTRELVQIRIYNSKMRRRRGYGTILRWYYEGYSIRKNIELIDQIDKQIEEEVSQEIFAANTRFQNQEAERIKLTQ